MKEYSSIEMEIIRFNTEDVITSSNCDPIDDGGCAQD